MPVAKDQRELSEIVAHSGAGVVHIVAVLTTLGAAITELVTWLGTGSLESSVVWFMVSLGIAVIWRSVIGLQQPCWLGRWS